MVQSLQLGMEGDRSQTGMRRLNRLPIILMLAIAVIFLAIVVVGLSWRGLPFERGDDLDGASGGPATSFGDQLKRGITDGIIGEPEPEIFQPAPVVVHRQERRQPVTEVPEKPADQRPKPAPEEDWQARLKREQDEQYLREVQRQRMARLQARASAFDSPLKVDIVDVAKAPSQATPDAQRRNFDRMDGTSDLHSMAARLGLLDQTGDKNGQASKQDFFNQDIRDLGYLPARVVPPVSLYELKRGSVIPATLITGLNSDLPGRLSVQVSQNVYDSATGYRLLIPQGARLFGRYDSKVAFRQDRALVVWTDLIFPNGATLQIGGMAGTDAAGYGGFKDKVDRHLLRTFGSAALIALIGTGIDLSMPESSTLANQHTASDAARRNFAESYGRVAEQTISRNLAVQPTIRIRPGYKFNILVDQDIVFPSAYTDG
ncbi:MAG TPA: IncP-type conjugal transfer protein TrbI [Pseudorhizobium sp.]|nr:IncP-type conjugal transfer protein TrbI [Pseudorhizobium sp.]